MEHNQIQSIIGSIGEIVIESVDGIIVKIYSKPCQE